MSLMKSRVPRRLLIAACMTAICAAAPATAAAAPRLDGVSKATVKYTKLVNIGGEVGDPFHQRYIFDAACGSGSCERVQLRRRHGKQKVRPAINLRRISGDFYRGRGTRILHSNGCRVRQTTKARVRITRASGGRARRFRARLDTTLKGLNCPGHGRAVEQAKGKIKRG